MLGASAAGRLRGIDTTDENQTYKMNQRTMRRIAVLCALGLLLFSCARYCAGPGDEGVYEPLARISVQAGDQRQGDRFVVAVDKFSKDHHYELRHGDFPWTTGSSTRTVYNARITISSITFFRIVNMRDAGVFDVSIYSHDKKEAWTLPWNDFLKRLHEILPEVAIEQKK
jgi:hypothetical protein